jgi:hypothetical protein
MVILGEVLVVGGSALVVCSVWSAIKQKLLRGLDEALDQPAGNGNSRTLGCRTLAALFGSTGCHGELPLWVQKQTP